MWVQGLMGIVGFLVIFGLLSFITSVVIKRFFPKTARELATVKLQKQIEQLEVLKIEIETKKYETTLKTDELKYEKEILKANSKLDKLKEKLNNLNNGE